MAIGGDGQGGGQGNDEGGELIWASKTCCRISTGNEGIILLHLGKGGHDEKIYFWFKSNGS